MTEATGKKPDKKRVPLKEGLFTLPASLSGKPRLIATKCRKCGEVFFPKRMVCLNCSAMDMEELLLSTRGKIFTFTIVRQAPPDSIAKAPYGLGSIQMPEGVHVRTVLADCDLDKLEVGMDVELVLEKIKEDEQGNSVMAYKFKPCLGSESPAKRR